MMKCRYTLIYKHTLICKNVASTCTIIILTCNCSDPELAPCYDVYESMTSETCTLPKDPFLLEGGHRLVEVGRHCV